MRGTRCRGWIPGRDRPRLQIGGLPDLISYARSSRPNEPVVFRRLWVFFGKDGGLPFSLGEDQASYQTRCQQDEADGSFHDRRVRRCTGKDRREQIDFCAGKNLETPMRVMRGQNRESETAPQGSALPSRLPAFSVSISAELPINVLVAYPMRGQALARPYCRLWPKKSRTAGDCLSLFAGLK